MRWLRAILGVLGLLLVVVALAPRAEAARKGADYSTSPFRSFADVLFLDKRKVRQDNARTCLLFRRS